MRNYDKAISIASVFLMGFAIGFLTLEGQNMELKKELAAVQAREASLIVQECCECTPPTLNLEIPLDASDE